MGETERERPEVGVHERYKVRCRNRQTRGTGKMEGPRETETRTQIHRWDRKRSLSPCRGSHSPDDFPGQTGTVSKPRPHQDQNPAIPTRVGQRC